MGDNSNNGGGIMKYLIAILSVLGLITVGTTLFPSVQSGVKFAQTKFQNDDNQSTLKQQQPTSKSTGADLSGYHLPANIPEIPRSSFDHYRNLLSICEQGLSNRHDWDDARLMRGVSGVAMLEGEQRLMLIGGPHCRRGFIIANVPPDDSPFPAESAPIRFCIATWDGEVHEQMAHAGEDIYVSGAAAIGVRIDDSHLDQDFGRGTLGSIEVVEHDHGVDSNGDRIRHGNRTSIRWKSRATYCP